MKKTALLMMTALTGLSLLAACSTTSTNKDQKMEDTTSMMDDQKIDDKKSMDKDQKMDDTKSMDKSSTTEEKMMDGKK